MDQQHTVPDEFAREIAALKRRLRQRENFDYALVVVLFAIFSYQLRPVVGVPTMLSVRTLTAEAVRIGADNGNKERISLDDRGGRPSLAFYDDRHREVMKLGVDGEGVPFMELYDPTGAVRTAIRSGTDRAASGSYLSFYGHDGTTLLRVGLAEGDLPVVQLNGRSGEELLALRTTREGEARLRLASSNQSEAIELIASDRSGAMLRIISHNQERLRLPQE
jgi:hypothetical protein